ncbi:RNA polymerase II degradation factor 1-like, partial [Aphis craccivora]
VGSVRNESLVTIHVMYSNAEHVAPTAVLILILCVLSTDQTLFSRKKSTTPATALDNVALQSDKIEAINNPSNKYGIYCTRRPVPQKETSHWWQRKHKPAKTNENPVPNQVAVAVPVPIHQKEIQDRPNNQYNMPRKKLVVKSILHNRIDYQCEIDLTDKELNSDNDFKLIMVHEDTHTKFLQSIFETHFNSDVKWVPCLCPVRKGEYQQQHQQPQQQQQQQQPQSQQPQPQQPQPQQRPQYQQPQKSQQYGPSTQAPSDNDVARFYFSNYPVEA